MNRCFFKRIGLAALGMVLLYYNVAWAVLRCPHQENPQVQEIAAYEAELADHHANLDCTGPKYHTESLAGPSSASELLRLATDASHENVSVGLSGLASSRIADDSRITFSHKLSLAALPFHLPRYLLLAVLRF